MYFNYSNQPNITEGCKTEQTENIISPDYVEMT